MNVYSIHKLGTNKGAPRLYLEGNKTQRAGFTPGNHYEVEVSVEKSMVALRLKDGGSRVVSKKQKRGEDVPVIDINSQEILKVFEGMEAVRVIMRNAEIFILPLATEVRKNQRVKDFKDKMARNEPITVGSLSHGIGVLSHAVHKGFTNAGVKSKLSFALDIRDELLEQASSHNDAWDKDTQIIAAPIQEVAFDPYAMANLNQVNILEMGIPCSGHSVAGRAKRGTAIPEDHPEVGHLIAAAIAIIARVNPIGILFENVVPYGSSASMSILRNQLKDFGYTCHEDVLEGADWNELENRKRFCMVAVSEGVDFDFSKLKKPVKVERTLSEILENVPEDDARWSQMAGLKAKQERDIEKGNNFKMQVFNGESNVIGTITKGYSKIRSTDPKIQHPSNPDLLRQITPDEHCLIKGVPKSLIEGLSNTIAHEGLGQSINYNPFVSVANLLMEELMAFSATKQQLRLAA